MCFHYLTCEKAARQLHAYLDQELDAATSADIDRHVTVCRECARRVAFEKRLRARVQETGTRKAPDRLYRRIKRTLDRS